MIVPMNVEECKCPQRQLRGSAGKKSVACIGGSISASHKCPTVALDHRLWHDSLAFATIEHIRLLSTRAVRTTRLYDGPFGAMAQEERSKAQTSGVLEHC
jgi:hypothetical protein